LKILIPIDGSPFSNAAAAFVAARALPAAAVDEAELLHVQPSLPLRAPRQASG